MKTCAIPGLFAVMCLLSRQAWAQEELLARYSNAVVRASTPATQERVSRNLTAVRQDNTNLLWTRFQNDDYVLVSSFMGAATATNNYQVGVWGSVWNGRESWVTMVPQLADFCRAYTNANPGADLALRGKQLLGLNPSWNQTHVVEYYIASRYLARPAPDTDITDHEAEIDFSYTNQSIFPRSVDGAYYTWYTNRVATVYQAASGPLGDDDVPWGRLGYTWDWAHTNENVRAEGDTVFGLSEFIIPAQFYTGSIPIYVVTVMPITDYGALSLVPDPPDVLAPTGSLTEGFLAQWSPVTRGAAYLLDVARDEQFTDFVQEYSNLLVLASTSQQVSPLVAGTYYFRVSSVSPSGTSLASATQSVQLESRRLSPMAWLFMLWE